MNILVLNWRDINNPQKGGAEIILYEFLKRLAKSGHNIIWFSESFKGAKKEEDFKGIKIKRKGNRYSVYFHALIYYLKLNQKPDIVLDCINTICWQTPLYIKKSKRIFYANQSAREIFFYEYPLPFSLLGYLLEPLQYLTYKKTNTLCYSQSIKEDLISYGLPEKNIKVFPLGLDNLRYKPSKKSKDPTFVFVARFVKNKRPGLCIEAMNIVIKKYPSAKLYLVGYGEEENNLKRLITKYKLNENILIVNKNNMFLEDNKKDIKVKLMQEAWALLLPSVKEGWGMVVTEAASCGTPAIVSDVTGLKDSVVSEKTGLILSKRPTKEELSKAIIKLIEHKKIREQMSHEAIKWSKNFNWEKSYKIFKNLIQV